MVVLAGHLHAWLGSRQSVEPVTGRFVDTTTCLQDQRDEVVLVGVLRRFDRTTVHCTYMCTYASCLLIVTRAQYWAYHEEVGLLM